MSKYRKKPVVIEAYPLPDMEDGAAIDEFHEWANTVGFTEWFGDYDGIVIPTLEGDMLVYPGDWIIKGVAGEFYPCKPNIFAVTYEPVDE